MKRRIVLAMLLTVWAMLVASGAAAYLIARSALLAQLDASLAARATSLPELARATSARGGGGGGGGAALLPDDRYAVHTAQGQNLARPGAHGAGRSAPPAVLGATFSRGPDGRRVRTIRVEAMAEPPGALGGELMAVTVTFSGTAGQFDTLLDRLALTLGGFGLIGGFAAAGLVARAARVALAPLRATAETIGEIDERRLDRRIDVSALPRELLPMGQRLNEMLVRLEEAFAQRRQFMADASHELRTPVAALVTGLEVSLRHPREAAAYRRTLESCLGDARLLRRLVERLMEQVRGESPQWDEAPIPVDVSALLAEVAQLGTTLGEARGVRVVRSFEVGVQFSTQPARLRSVVTNLVGNAVEYNRPGGQVELKCELGRELRIIVRDTGPGIAPEHIGHVFEPFYRGDASHGPDAEHLGLGLALVQTHARAMGGRVEVESAPGVGTTFTVTLPAPAGEAAAGAGWATAGTAAAASQDVRTG